MRLKLLTVEEREESIPLPRFVASPQWGTEVLGGDLRGSVGQPFGRAIRHLRTLRVSFARVRIETIDAYFQAVSTVRPHWVVPYPESLRVPPIWATLAEPPRHAKRAESGWHWNLSLTYRGLTDARKFSLWRLIDMTYSQLRATNPSDDDLTRASSIWMASRVPSGRGAAGAAVPHFRDVGGSAMRALENGDLRAAGLLAANDAGAVVEARSDALAWRGLWAAGIDAAIGRGHPAHGLVFPLSTFNAGYRCRGGWRPGNVG